MGDWPSWFKNECTELPKHVEWKSIDECIQDKKARENLLLKGTSPDGQTINEALITANELCGYATDAFKHGEFSRSEEFFNTASSHLWNAIVSESKQERESAYYLTHMTWPAEKKFTGSIPNAAALELLAKCSCNESATQFKQGKFGQAALSAGVVNLFDLDGGTLITFCSIFHDLLVFACYVSWIAFRTAFATYVYPGVYPKSNVRFCEAIQALSTLADISLQSEAEYIQTNTQPHCSGVLLDQLQSLMSATYCERNGKNCLDFFPAKTFVKSTDSFGRGIFASHPIDRFTSIFQEDTELSSAFSQPDGQTGNVLDILKQICMLLAPSNNDNRNTSDIKSSTVQAAACLALSPVEQYCSIDHEHDRCSMMMAHQLWLSGLRLTPQHIFRLCFRLRHFVHTTWSFEAIPHSSALDVRVEGLQQVRHGLAYFPFGSLVNHSCSPNAFFAFDESGNLHCVSLRHIEQGEQVTVSYGPVSGAHTTAFRQVKLKQHFSFDCACDACKKGTDETYVRCNNMACPSESGTYTLHFPPNGTSEQYIRCSSCNSTIVGEDALVYISRASRPLKIALQVAMRNTKDAQYHGSEFISASSSLLNAIGKSSEVLNPGHPGLGEALDALAKIEVRRGNFKEAAEQLRKAIQGIEIRLGKGPEWSIEAIKLAQLLAIVGQGNQTSQASRDAIVLCSEASNILLAFGTCYQPLINDANAILSNVNE